MPATIVLDKSHLTGFKSAPHYFTITGASADSNSVVTWFRVSFVGLAGYVELPFSCFIDEYGRGLVDLTDMVDTVPVGATVTVVPEVPDNYESIPTFEFTVIGNEGPECLQSAPSITNYAKEVENRFEDEVRLYIMPQRFIWNDGLTEPTLQIGCLSCDFPDESVIKYCKDNGDQGTEVVQKTIDSTTHMNTEGLEIEKDPEDYKRVYTLIQLGDVENDPFVLYYPLRPTEPDLNVNYCVIRWQNRFGYYNIFKFELHDVQRCSYDDLALFAYPTEKYNIKKKYFYKGVLYLDGLTAYDMWFYSDIITSSDVSMYQPKTNHSFRKIKVTTDKFKLPTSDADKRFALSIEIEFDEVNRYI